MIIHFIILYVVYFADLDFDDSTKVPCILHMDSIKGSHAGLKNLVQRYVSCLTAIFQFCHLSIAYTLSIYVSHLPDEMIIYFPDTLFALNIEENAVAPCSVTFELCVELY